MNSIASEEDRTRNTLESFVRNGQAAQAAADKIIEEHARDCYFLREIQRHEEEVRRLKSRKELCPDAREFLQAAYDSLQEAWLAEAEHRERTRP